MEEYYSYSVPIPARVKTRMEIVEGVGIPEIFVTGISAIIRRNYCIHNKWNN